MSSESNVGLRILVIGKDAGVAATRELLACADKVNAGTRRAPSRQRGPQSDAVVVDASGSGIR
jgi:hypothetical protein